MPTKPKTPTDDSAGKGAVRSNQKGGKSIGGHNGEGKGKGRGYGVVDPKAMPAEDRAKVLDHLRNLRRIAQAKAGAMAAKLEADPGAKLDSYECQALLNLEKSISEILASHPGLLELSNAVSGVGGNGAIGGADAAERLREALGRK